MSKSVEVKQFDCFGNEIDREVGYARGSILSDSFSEKIKQQHAVTRIKKYIEKNGEESLSIFTGNIRDNQLNKDDLGIRSEEWVGPSLFQSQLREKVLAHLGVNEGETKEYEVAIFNRTSAAIVSSILAFAKPHSTILSYAAGKKAHPSVSRGAKLANAQVTEIENLKELEKTDLPNGSVCVITGVTSELLLLNEEEFVNGIKIAKEKGFIIVVDDAYGARIRPILLGHPHALSVGADIVISNNDKAALHGPRAGIMGGKKDYVVKASAKASEYGLEARAPIALAVLRSVENFQKEELIGEKEIGDALYENLSQRLGTEKVRKTLLGPEISAENVTKYILEQKKIDSINLVPAEVSTAIGFILLDKYGIITTNTCGMPGARVSLRLKTNEKTVSDFGGIELVVNAVMSSIGAVADYIEDEQQIKGLILGH